MLPRASTWIDTQRALAATVAQWSRTSSHRPMPDSLPVLRGERLVLRPIEDADLEPLMAIVTSPSVGQWWGSADHDDLRNDGHAFAIEVEGEVAGWLGYEEENEPDYQHWGIDISLAPSQQAHGLGPEALRTVIDWLVAERGHHRFTIDP